MQCMYPVSKKTHQVEFQLMLSAATHDNGEATISMTRFNNHDLMLPEQEKHMSYKLTSEEREKLIEILSIENAGRSYRFD